MDFPVSGGTQRTWFKDVEARAAIQQLDPASVINVSDITALTDEQCEGLVAGGAVNKSDSTGKHSYKVTYKSATGMCLTYADADNVETVSYDKIDGTWTYNSTDRTPISGKADKSTTVTGVNYDATNKKITKTINGSTTDVVSVSTLKTDMNLSKGDVGLGSVGNFKAVSTEASQGLDATEQGNARANIGAGTYSKPSGGIPKTDLAEAVQTSLGKADTAIQSNPVMTGATASAAGAKGLVPQPAAGDNVKFLRGDGTWSDDLPRASFVGNTLVFSSGGVFSGSTLLLS